jgi:hypothetical protein
MFTANNDTILLRQIKKQIVLWVEQCIPEHVLELGTSVMTMQVSCQLPGCVPLETIIFVVFPKSSQALMAGLPESAGGTFKTKILKPMNQIQIQDIYDALPPSFINGQYTIEKTYCQIRDQMFGLMTQAMTITENENNETKKEDGKNNNTSSSSTTSNPTNNNNELKLKLAQYLQQSLQDYIDHQCTPPAIGQSYPGKIE